MIDRIHGMSSSNPTRDWELTYATLGIVQEGVLPTVKRAAEVFSGANCETILDLGCGSGRHTEYLANEGFKVIGVDQAASGLKLAQKRVRPWASAVTFIQADMQSTGLATATIDGLLCVWATGHGYRDDLIATIRETARITKAGGIVCSDFPSRADANYNVGTQIAPHTFLHPHLNHSSVPHYYPSREELENELSRYFQFQMEEISYWDPKYGKSIPAYWVECTRNDILWNASC